MKSFKNLNFGTLVSFALILALFILTIFVGNELLLEDNTSNERAEAVFGGEPESGYEFVGYIIVETASGDKSLCGVNYISERIGVTAAHCIENGYTDIYPNTDEYTPAYERTAYSVINAEEAPNYDGMFSSFDAAIDDFAIIEFGEDVILDEYAEITRPQEGCNYYITGYGVNENGLNIDRLGGDICIDRVDSERIEIRSGDVFFCTGDSGSGIYEKDTNNLVGIVSSFSPPGPCPEATTFYAARADVQQRFVTSYSNGVPIIAEDEQDEPTPIPTSQLEEDERISDFTERDQRQDRVLNQTQDNFVENNFEGIEVLFILICVGAIILFLFLITLYLVYLLIRNL
jgi:V8-like Glu-specific endopeptidase